MGDGSEGCVARRRAYLARGDVISSTGTVEVEVCAVRCSRVLLTPGRVDVDFCAGRSLEACLLARGSCAQREWGVEERVAVQPGCGRTRGQAHRGGRSAGLSFIALATLLLTDDCTPDRGIYRYMHDAYVAVGARIRITVV